MGSLLKIKSLKSKFVCQRFLYFRESIHFGWEVNVLPYYDCLSLWDPEGKVLLCTGRERGSNRYNGDSSSRGVVRGIAHGTTRINRLTKKCFQSLDIKRTKIRKKMMKVSWKRRETLRVWRTERRGRRSLAVLPSSRSPYNLTKDQWSTTIKAIHWAVPVRPCTEN